MVKQHFTKAMFLIGGVVLGLAAGLNLPGIWPRVPLYATATQGQDNYAIATGLVDEQVEALYFLDFLTGDLKAAVINPKNGKFIARFQYNIAADFQRDRTRSPKYLMVTGLADMPRGRSNFQVAKSIVYISDVSTGQVAAYTIPWNQSLQSAGRPQAGEFIPLDRMEMRTVPIRDAP